MKTKTKILCAIAALGPFVGILFVQGVIRFGYAVAGSEITVPEVVALLSIIFSLFLTMMVFFVAREIIE